MKYTSSELKAVVAGYFRYKKQCPIIAFEASNQLKCFNGEPADVLVVTESRMLYEVEVKVSLSDLKNDRRKCKHQSFTNKPNYLPVYKYFFAVPMELSNDALPILDEFYPYAGLLSISNFPFQSTAFEFGVREVRSPKQLNIERLSLKQITFLVKEQSGTVTRLARDKALAEKHYKATLTENSKLKKLLILAGVSFS